jgi:hypothetical protein
LERIMIAIEAMAIVTKRYLIIQIKVAFIHPSLYIIAFMSKQR